MCRRCGEEDRRPNSRQRKVLRAWLVSPDAPWGGDGEKVACANGMCGGVMLTAETLEFDRLVPGWLCLDCGVSRRHHGGSEHTFRGGGYNRKNVAPSCGPCNRGRNAGNPWEHEVDPSEVRCLTR